MQVSGLISIRAPDRHRCLVAISVYEFQGPIMLHVLLATDGSSGADRAVDFAARLAKEVAGKLSILTVGGNVSGVDMRELARAESGIGDALEAVSGQILERARRRAHEAGATDVGVRAGWGDPAEVIIEAAGRDQVDAIVMGRRGRGRLTGLLLGSVSQK